MENVKEYIVVSMKGYRNFSVQITGHLTQNGYKLSGGVSTVVLDGEIWYSQALVK